VPRVILVALVAFGAALLTLFSGFGLGTLLLPAFAALEGIRIEVAVAATAVVHLVNNLFKVVLLGRHAVPWIVVAFGLPAALASFLGAKVLLGLDAELARVVVGLLIVVFALLELNPRTGKLALPRSLLPLGGLLSGFVGGLSGLQGAIRSAFLLRFSLTREQFLGTGICCAIVIDAARLAVYGGGALGGQLGQLRGIGAELAIGIAAAIAGSWAGSRLVKKVTIGALHQFVGVLLVVLGAGIAVGVV
jgi:uncharacterized membrane protein YfcA